MMDGLKKIKGFAPIMPQGAFYIFCSIKETGLDSVSLANELLDKAKLAVIPGKPFGSDEHIRLSFATSSDEITKGIDRLSKWAKRQ